MAWRLRDFLRKIGMMHDFSPEDLHHAEIENFRFDQQKIIEAISQVAEGRRAGFARLRQSIQDARLSGLTAFDEFDERIKGHSSDDQRPMQ